MAAPTAEHNTVCSGSDSAAEYHEQSLADGRACLEAALAYRRRGWPVLSLCTPDHVGMRWVSREHCSRCDHPGKVPWHTWTEFQPGPNGRLPSEDEIKSWWKQLPAANVGLALGHFCRLDVDGAAGEARLNQVSGGELPPTLEFRRGGSASQGLLYQ